MTRHSPLVTTMWIVNNPLGECVKIFSFSSPSDANVSGGSRRRIDPSTGPTFKGSDRMKMDAFAFGTTNWAEIEKIEHPGETGMAYWRTQFFGEKPNQIRVRMVEYTPGYLADHWCQKGHILFCLEGELETTLKDGRKFALTTGMSYQVGDNAEPHQSILNIGQVRWRCLAVRHGRACQTLALD